MTTSTDDGAPSDGEPAVRRYPCPWCELPDVWPDRCAEELDNAERGESVFRCAELIEKHCARDGDHRRCQIGACVVSTRWHEPVRLAGMAAARAMGRAWAVVSTIHNGIELAGFADEVEQAERLRYRTVVNAGREHDPESRWRIYIVRGSDGGFM